MTGGGPLHRHQSTPSALSAPTDPLNPFAGRRGFDRLDPERLRAHLDRYYKLLAEVERHRGVWPRPDNARHYCECVIAELEAELAARSGVAA